LLFVAGYPRERISFGSGAILRRGKGLPDSRASPSSPRLTFRVKGNPAVKIFMARGRCSLFARRPFPIRLPLAVSPWGQACRSRIPECHQQLRNIVTGYCRQATPYFHLRIASARTPTYTACSACTPPRGPRRYPNWCLQNRGNSTVGIKYGLHQNDTLSVVGGEKPSRPGKDRREKDGPLQLEQVVRGIQCMQG